MKATISIYSSKELNIKATTRNGGLMVETPCVPQPVFLHKKLTGKFLNDRSVQWIVLYEQWNDLSQESGTKKVPTLKEYVSP